MTGTRIKQSNLTLKTLLADERPNDTKTWVLVCERKVQMHSPYSSSGSIHFSRTAASERRIQIVVESVQLLERYTRILELENQMPAWICDGTNTDAYNLTSVTNANAVVRRGKRVPVGTWGDRHQHGCKLLSRIFNGRRHGSPVCSRKPDGVNLPLGVLTHLDRLRSAGMKLCGKQPDQLAINALHAFGNTIGRRLRDFDVPPFLRIAKQLKTNLHLLPND